MSTRDDLAAALARERLAALQVECNELAAVIARERVATQRAMLAAIDAHQAAMSAAMAGAVLGAFHLTPTTAQAAMSAAIVRAAKVRIEAPPCKPQWWVIGNQHAQQALPSSVPVTPNGMPDHDGRIAELAAAERAISDALPEDDGYASPWVVNAYSTPIAYHHEWRTARRSYAATGSADDLASMLEYVTHDNPPLRSDSAAQRHKARGQASARHRSPTALTVAKRASQGLAGAVFVLALAAIVLGLLAFMHALVS
jgi:hypothetical protein